MVVFVITEEEIDEWMREGLTPFLEDGVGHEVEEEAIDETAGQGAR